MEVSSHPMQFHSVAFPAAHGRRSARTAAVRVCAILCMLSCGPALAFSFNDVALRAKRLATAPFKKPSLNLPKELQNLEYEQYQNIRYRPEKVYWRSAKLPFELAFFHRGWHFDQPVKIHEITSEGITEIKFDPGAFDYGASKLDARKMHGVSGFAGFRIHFPVNTPKYKDEVLSFLGASYFRALGKGQLYGLSARGLAVDTALSSGEEFPRFVEFWIERPTASAKELTIYGLLDSRRVTGAYRFVLKPGVDTVLEVRGQLYLRENVSKLGLAPLTSMFFYGENQPSGGGDFRPEVHDSDGLLINSGTGEWIWRPLHNPKRLLVTSFAMTNPLGFGLMQRDREFGHYEDLDARYELRPSAWVEPKGQWGPGRIELIQIPAPDETNDNIVAFWVPDNAVPPRQPYDFEYRLLWQKDAETRPPLSWVAQTRRGRGYTRKPDGSIGFALDFDGPALRKLQPDAKLEWIFSVDANGQLLERKLVRNGVTGGWRVMLRLRRIDENKPVEMRGYLRSGNELVSETWSYIIPPN